MRIWLFIATVIFLVPCAAAEFSDPMQPPAYALQKFRLEKLKKMAPVNSAPVKKQAAQQWVLSSILYSSQRKHAIINNQLVKQGEMVQGARLIRLTPHSARLRVKGRVIELTVLDKKTTGNFKALNKSLNESKL